MNLRHTQLLRSVTEIIAGNAAVMVIQFVSGFLVARWVQPYEMGVWNTFQIVNVYTPFITIGIFSGLNRELPYYCGLGREADARQLSAAAYGFSWLLALLTIPLTLVATGVAGVSHGSMFIAAALVTGGSIIFNWLTIYYNTTYRTFSDFGRLATKNTLGAAAGLLLLGLVWKYGYYGMLIRAVMVSVITMVILSVGRPMPVKPRFQWKSLVHLMKIGIPIFLLGQLWTVHTSFDRMVLLKDTISLGYFTVALQVGTAARLIPTAFTVALFPKMAERYAATHNAIDLWLMLKPAVIAATGLGLLTGLGGWLLIPPLVKWFVPSYSPGIPAAQWASFLGLAMSLYIFGNVFNIIKRQDFFMINWIVALLLFWATWVVLGKYSSDKMLSASIAMLFSTFGSSLVGVFTALIACRIHDRKMVNNVIPAFS